MKLWYKALTGFGEERTVSFPADELEKATYAFLREKRVAFKDGQAVDGKYIQQIQPDWHRIMGWTEGYKLGVHEYNILRDDGADRLARDFQSKVNARVHFLLQNGREKEIGTNAAIPELDTKPQLREGQTKSMKELLEKKKI